jgi:ribosomal protein S18 acetylase RimI-like enzyme
MVPENDPVEVIQKRLIFQYSLFVALLKDMVIGSVMVGYEGHRDWVNCSAILPEHRKRRGLQGIVERPVNEIEEMWCLKVNLQVLRSNMLAVEFYKHLGLRDEGVVSLDRRLK